MQPFFPNPYFGWCFYAVLTGFLAVAAYIDLRWLWIPKQLTLPMLGIGLLFTLARGIWMGGVFAEEEGKVVWLFANSPALGALDALLFALAGFAVGLTLFFLFRLLGMAGGGDMKLIAALGVWVGPWWLLGLLLVSLFVLVLLTTLSLARRLLRRGPKKAFFGSRGPGVNPTKKMPAGTRRRDQLVNASLPVAIATALTLPWLCRAELRLPLPTPAPGTQASAQP